MKRIVGPLQQWRRRTRSERRQWYALLVIAGLLIPVLSVPTGAVVAGGFEIDADTATTGDADDPSREVALYSGNDQPPGVATDWVTGMTEGAPAGVFTPTAESMTPTAASDCYGSDIDVNPAITGVATLICDGHSSPVLRTVEPEKNKVSPAGKSNDGVWPIKAGNVKGKNDITHGYVYASLGDSPCDEDTDPDNLFLHLAGHRGDKEGDAFWGFEFNKNEPGGFADLLNGDPGDLTFDRSPDDLLIAFEVSSAAVGAVVYTIEGPDPDSGATVDWTLAEPACGGSVGDGDTELATNQADDDNDILAPPWSVPVCDPTLTNAANQCRLVNAGQDDKLIGDRLFAEATIDLAAYGFEALCVSSVVFTSRASTSSSADIDDVSGGQFDLCGAASGSKFHDQDRDGTWDKTGDAPEPGLSGWTINIYSDDGANPGVLDAADGTAFSATTTTATGGAYSFSNLDPGDYIVCEVLQSDWTQSSPTVESGVCSADPFEENLGGGGHAFTMTPAGVANLDFGNFSEGTVTGLKFKDVDDDGAYSATIDSELGGWTITAYSDVNDNDTLDLSDTVAAFTSTASDTASVGTYSIDLAPGDYILCETGQDGWTQTAPSNAICALAGSGHAPGGHTVTVTSGATAGDLNFGNAPLSTITVTFNPLTNFTEATEIVCKADNGSGMTVGVVSDTDTLTTDEVSTGDGPVVCTIAFRDP